MHILNMHIFKFKFVYASLPHSVYLGTTLRFSWPKLLTQIHKKCKRYTTKNMENWDVVHKGLRKSYKVIHLRKYKYCDNVSNIIINKQCPNSGLRLIIWYK